MGSTIVAGAAVPSLSALLGEVLAVWPEHEAYLRTSLAGRNDEAMRHSERVATMIVRLAGSVDGGLPALAADYRHLCEDILLPEEIHFRRFGAYRLSRFDEARQEVYDDAAFMGRYMNGLLLSQALWLNHCLGLQHYAERFLSGLDRDAELLEVGPGHGLLLCLAGDVVPRAVLSAWDVSQTSLDHCRRSLAALGARAPVRFERTDPFDPSATKPQDQFDAIVLSEVLEHLEDPQAALRSAWRLCRPGGRIWLNVPANSPAPDHLFLLNDPQRLEDMVEAAGFSVLETASFPMAGVSLEKAIRQQRTITCIVVGERSALGEQ